MRLSYALAFIVVVVDQLSKWQVQSSMELGQSIPWISGVFHITYVHNTGAAFGLFRGKQLWLAGVGILALIVIWAMRKSIVREGRKIEMCYALIWGGAAGNVIDRLLYGQVIDFLDARVWPVFNLADTAISIGVGGLIACTLFCSKQDH